MTAGRKRFLQSVFLATVCLFLLQGCKREGIQTYQIPKETEKPTPPSTPASQAIPERLTWEKPAHWIEVPSGPLRQASFKVAGTNQQEALVTVIALPNPAGGELDNVNRWRGQVGLAAIPAHELKTQTEEVRIAGLPGHLFDMAGSMPGQAGATRILAAILARETHTWFFKMNGDDRWVQEQKPVFVEFIDKIRFSSGP